MALGIAIAEGYAYVADDRAGLSVIDVSAPDNPTLAASCGTSGPARDVAVAGSYAYVTDYAVGLRVVDISNPVNPTGVSLYEMSGYAKDIAISGSSLYVVALEDQYRGSLRVVDVSTPVNPTEVGLYDTPLFPTAVAAGGDYAYIAEHEGGWVVGLSVIDASIPSNPKRVGSCDWLGGILIQGVAVVGGYAYVAFGEDGLRAVDVSNPAHPVEVGYYDTPGIAGGVAVAGGYAYVADGSEGLRVVDVSNPATPTEVGFYDTPGSAGDVAVAGGYAYVTDMDAGLFILRYEEPVVHEARADIGMPYSAYRGCLSPYSAYRGCLSPYSAYRGCLSPYTGCGGPYHGFYYGVCTDLAMDAYNAGVPFNIQDALYQDLLAHPGRYRYGSARNAEDMRRYFHYNQQWLPHTQTYQPGDIAFFDWNADGLCDHVGVVSEVDAGGHPTRMVHAPGVCSVNPSGRAFEQDWNSHYDQHIQGHARLSETGALTASADETLQLLRVAIDSPSMALSLRDANGKSTSDTYDENLVATGVEASIPYIPGGWYADQGAEQIITVTWPLSNTNQYFVQLTGQSAATYHLRVETLQGASVTHAEVFTQAIAPGETHGSAITLSTAGGTIEFSATSPTPAPLSDVPESLTLAGLVGTSAQGSCTINETGGQQALQSVDLSATELMDSLGGLVSGSLLSISPDDFTVPAGGSQQLDVQVNLAGVAPGVYRGALVIRSDNAGTRMIPLTLEVQFHQVHLPTIFKSY